MRAVSERPERVRESDIVWFHAPWVAEWNAKCRKAEPEPPSATPLSRKLARRERANMGRIWAKYKRQSV